MASKFIGNIGNATGLRALLFPKRYYEQEKSHNWIKVHFLQVQKSGRVVTKFAHFFLRKSLRFTFSHVVRRACNKSECCFFSLSLSEARQRPKEIDGKGLKVIRILCFCVVWVFKTKDPGRKKGD